MERRSIKFTIHHHPVSRGKQRRRKFKQATLGDVPICNLFSDKDLLCCEVKIYYGGKMNVDLDNALKSILDSMKGKVFPDDRQIVDLHAVAIPESGESRIDITVEAVDLST